MKARILHVHDLHAADAVYHQTCSVNFRTGKQKPMAHQSASTEDSKRPKPGWPQVDERAVAFLQVAQYLEENDDEQITIDHLIDLMEQKLTNTAHKAYGYTHMKNRLQEHFGEKIILTEINGKSNVATFRTTARAMLHEYYKQQQQEKTQLKKR